MGLIACPVPGKAKSKMLVEAFIAGAPEDAVGRVFYGVKRGNRESWSQALFRLDHFGQPYYFIDNAYFDQTRGRMFRVTKNRIQHDGYGATTGERFAAVGAEIAPWRDFTLPGTVLSIQQSDDHMRFTVGMPTWLESAEREMAKRLIGPLKRRPWTADKPEAQVTLAADLADARMVVTHTSAAAVMATLAGVPACVSPMSSAFKMTNSADRLRWAGVLADNQFTLDEMMNGTAWRKVSQ